MNQVKRKHPLAGIVSGADVPGTPNLAEQTDVPKGVNLLKLAALANPNESSYQDIAPSYSPPPSDALPAAGAALGLAASIPGARMMGEANVRRHTPQILGGMRDEAIQNYNQGIASQNQMIAREREGAADQIRNLEANRAAAREKLLAARGNVNPEAGFVNRKVQQMGVNRAENRMNQVNAQMDTQNRLFRNAKPVTQNPAALKETLDAIPQSQAFKDATRGARVQGAKLGGVGGAVLGAAALGGLGLGMQRMQEKQAADEDYGENTPYEDTAFFQRVVKRTDDELQDKYDQLHQEGMKRHRNSRDASFYAGAGSGAALGAGIGALARPSGRGIGALALAGPGALGGGIIGAALGHSVGNQATKPLRMEMQAIDDQRADLKQMADRFGQKWNQESDEIKRLKATGAPIAEALKGNQ